MMYENYLEHHGVKGMRWGVRRQRARQLFGVHRKTRTDAKQTTPEEAKKARRRKIVIGTAIGAAAGAAIGAGTAHAIRRHKERKNFDSFADYMIKRSKDYSYADRHGTWSTFNKNRKNYSAKQYRNIVKAERKYGDSKEFRDAVNVKTKKRRK